MKIDALIQKVKLQGKPTIDSVFSDTNDTDLSQLMAKISRVNCLEHTRTPKSKIFEHLKILTAADYRVLREGKLNDAYYELVQKIASGHGICRRKKNGSLANEDNLTSFASKFCGHHNQTAPFWDNLVYAKLIEWGYPNEYRNYPDYVEAIKKLRKDNGLQKYSLRSVEMAIWSLAKHEG